MGSECEMKLDSEHNIKHFMNYDDLFTTYLLWTLNQASHLLQPGCGGTGRAGHSLYCWHLKCETYWSHIYTWKTKNILTLCFIMRFLHLELIF